MRKQGPRPFQRRRGRATLCRRGEDRAMMARATIALLSWSVASAPMLASETEFCDALRAIESNIRADFADNGSANVVPADQALTQLIGSNIAGFERAACGSPT